MCAGGDGGRSGGGISSISSFWGIGVLDMTGFRKKHEQTIGTVVLVLHLVLIGAFVAFKAFREGSWTLGVSAS